MAKDEFFYITTGTGTPTVTSTTSSTAVASVRVSGNTRPVTNMADIEKAVFAHIQAVRTLGRSHINTEEIAQALAIPQAYVIAAVENLKHKGVRVAA